jgi:hypothetical protein
VDQTPSSGSYLATDVSGEPHFLIQTALEAEIDEFLGRGRYQRTAKTPEARAGRGTVVSRSRRA